MTDEKKPEERVFSAVERLNLIEQAKVEQIRARQTALAMDLYFRQSALAALHRQQTLDWILGKTLTLPSEPRNGSRH